MYASIDQHTMKACVPQSSSSRPQIECLHWTDQHTGDPTNTWDWINEFAGDFYVRLQEVLGIQDHDAMVREIDRRATNLRIGVERLLDRLMGVEQSELVRP